MVLKIYLNKDYIYYTYLITLKYLNINIYKYFILNNLNLDYKDNYIINTDNIFKFLLDSKKNVIYLLTKTFNNSFLTKFIHNKTLNLKTDAELKNELLRVYGSDFSSYIINNLTIYHILTNKIILVFDTYNIFFKFFQKNDLFNKVINSFSCYYIVICILTSDHNFIEKKLNLFLINNNFKYTIEIINNYEHNFIKSHTNKNFSIKQFFNFNNYNNITTNNNFKTICKLLKILPYLKLYYKKNKLRYIKYYLTNKFKYNTNILNSLLKEINTIFYSYNYNKPLSNFLLCGPSGTGKTELAKILSYICFGSVKNLIKLNMSEYMEEHSISKLIGSPPGYVGYGETNEFIKSIEKYKNNIILFDEIEKAHKSINDLMLQILEEGKLTLSNGDILKFDKSIIIFTSNLGCSNIDNLQSLSGYNENILKSIKLFFRPEFLSRINNILIFKKITLKYLTYIYESILEKCNVKLNSYFNICTNFKHDFVNYTYNIIYGIRPLVKINNLLIDKLYMYNYIINNKNINNNIKNTNNLKFMNFRCSIKGYNK